MSILNGMWNAVKFVGQGIGEYVVGASKAVWFLTSWTFKGTWAMAKTVGTFAKASWNENHGFKAGLGVLAGVFAVPVTFVAGIALTATTLAVAVALPVAAIVIVGGVILPLAILFGAAAGLAWLAGKAFGRSVLIGTAINAAGGENAADMVDALGDMGDAIREKFAGAVAAAV